MSKHFLKRTLGLMLAMVLTVSALPVAALATEREFTRIPLNGTDVTIEGTRFAYTGEAITPDVKVQVQDRILEEGTDYTVAYANNIAVGTATVTITGNEQAAPSYGYFGTVEIEFEIYTNEPPYTSVEIKGTDVTIEGTSFPYTGSPIAPAVTVQVGGSTLVKDRDYAVEYINNLLPGTGTVIVRGIATASATLGYTGEVRIDFTIQEPVTEPDDEKPEEKPEEYPLVTIRHEDVTINGKQFPYTGKPIEPQITVTVDGKVLTQGKDYSLTYENNVEVGTGLAIVRGIATATEHGGYDGEVEVRFTIMPVTEEEYPLVEIKGTDVTISGTKFHYTGKAIEPSITVTVNGKTLTQGKDYSLNFLNNVEVGTATAIVTGIATATETGGYTGEVRIDFRIIETPADPAYQFTKGSGATWNQESSRTLTFTVNGNKADFLGLTINGKTVDDSYYTVKEGSTVITLRNSFLRKLGIGSYTITAHFDDGEAVGTFKVAAALDESNPKTGDSIHLWAALLFVSLTGLAGTAFACRKKRFQ